MLKRQKWMWILTGKPTSRQGEWQRDQHLTHREAWNVRWSPQKKESASKSSWGYQWPLEFPGWTVRITGVSWSHDCLLWRFLSLWLWRFSASAVTHIPFRPIRRAAHLSLRYALALWSHLTKSLSSSISKEIQTRSLKCVEYSGIWSSLFPSFPLFPCILFIVSPRFPIVLQRMVWWVWEPWVGHITVLFWELELNLISR